MWLKRVLPLVFYYQLAVMGPALIAKLLYTGNISKTSDTVFLDTFERGRANCMRAFHDEDDDGITELTEADVSPFLCQCPVDNSWGKGLRTTAERLKEENLYLQYGATATALGGSALEKPGGGFDDAVASAHGFTYAGWVGDGRTGTLYARAQQVTTGDKNVLKRYTWNRNVAPAQADALHHNTRMVDLLEGFHTSFPGASSALMNAANNTLVGKANPIHTSALDALRARGIGFVMTVSTKKSPGKFDPTKCDAEGWCDVDHFDALQACKLSGDQGRVALCWSTRALTEFGGKMPAISKKYNCGNWGTRKANAVGWIAFVFGELAFLVCTRTESFVWLPSHRTAQRDVDGAPQLRVNRKLWYALGAGAVYTLCFAFVPGLRDVMDTLPVSFSFVLLALFGVCIMVAGSELAKLWYRRALRRFQRTSRKESGLTRYWTEGGTAKTG